MNTNDTLNVTQGDLSQAMNNINSNLKTTQLKISNFSTKKSDRKFMLKVYKKEGDEFNSIHIGTLESIGYIVKDLEKCICL